MSVSSLTILNIMYKHAFRVVSLIKPASAIYIISLSMTCQFVRIRHLQTSCRYP